MKSKYTKNLAKEMARCQQEEKNPLTIHPGKVINKPCHRPASPKRYYIDKLQPDIYLTCREVEIATLLIQHHQYKTIAKQLSLSYRTVEFYVQSMRLKLCARNKKSLITCLKAIGLELELM